MGRINYWEDIIIVSVFLGMQLFENIMEYREYTCPIHCEVDHKHIKADDGL
jgi:hypothetical protein